MDSIRFHGGPSAPDDAQGRALLGRWTVAERSAFGVLGCPALSQDIASTILARVLAARGIEELLRLREAYFESAGRNEARKVLRNAKRREEILSLHADELRRHPQRPDEVFEVAERQRWIHTGTERLPPRTAKIARLSWLEGWTAVRIAEELGIGVKRVERHRKLARQRLGEECAQHLGTEDRGGDRGFRGLGEERDRSKLRGRHCNQPTLLE
jgi:RNA polymerase sigma factor (sigma-70 family)